MTLCIVSKLNGKITFASDSRISFGKDGYSDNCNKIFSVPVKVYTKPENVQKIPELIYDYTMGMCVAGSTTNAFLIKDTLINLLQNLQYESDNYQNLSIDSIMNIMLYVYKKSTHQLGQVLREISIAEIIIAGYCPKNNKIRFFKFYFDENAGALIKDKLVKKEILQEDGMEFLGSGSINAEKVYKEKDLSIIEIINKVKRKEKSVGGIVQYGEFIHINFKIRCLKQRNYIILEDGETRQRAKDSYLLPCLNVSDLKSDTNIKKETGLDIVLPFIEIKAKKRNIKKN